MFVRVRYVRVVVLGLPVCISIMWRQDVAVELVRRSSSSLEALVESRQGVHSRSSRPRRRGWTVVAAALGSSSRE